MLYILVKTPPFREYFKLVIPSRVFLILYYDLEVNKCRRGINVNDFVVAIVTTLPHLNLSCLIFSISHPHTLFSLWEGEDGESRSVPSRPEGEPEVGRELKNKLQQGLCAINRSRLDRVGWTIFCVRLPLIEKDS